MDSKTLLYGISGRKFSGKDTTGKHLCEKYGYMRLAYADALKEACREIFGFTDEQLYGSSKETADEFWKTSPRKVLQYVGTDLFRDQLDKVIPDLGKNIWIKVLEKKILDVWKKNPSQGIVITDLRFPNEVEAVKKLGGIVLRITRPSLESGKDMHSSEVEIDNLDVDFELLNDSTIDSLYDKFDKLYLS
jgi:hypothetical protein